MGRRAIMLVGTLSACTFSPSVDDTALVDCVADADCPRGASCLAQVCVPQPLGIVSLEAVPEVVEAGEPCTFTVTATHSLREQRLRYRWHQVLGSTVAVTSADQTAELTTTPGYVGSYAVEVIVENGRDPPARGRVHCTALVSDDAEYVVPGQSGNCTRDDPCGSISATSATRVYVGVDERVTGRPWLIAGSLDGFSNRELHGGFVFPEWKRDMNRSRTALSASSVVSVSCSSCVISGFTEERYFPESSLWRQLVYINRDGVTLREMHLTARGGSDDAVVSVIAATDSGIGTINIEGVRVVADGIRARDLWGLDLTVASARVVDTEIDLRGGVADEKVGAEITQAIDSPLFERVHVRLGDAEEARGLLVRCAAPRIVNTLVDLRGEGAGDSTALYLDSPAGCPTGGRIHSSLLVAGGGATSTGARLIDPEPSVAIVNTIIDGGQGFARVGIDAEGFDGPIDMAGTVVVLDGGEQTRDHWIRLAGAGLPVDAFEAAISCPGCLSTADNVAYADPDNGDYHLTLESACCVDSGSPLGANDPLRDYDGVSRDPSAPAVGPFELVIY